MPIVAMAERGTVIHNLEPKSRFMHVVEFNHRRVSKNRNKIRTGHEKHCRDFYIAGALLAFLRGMVIIARQAVRAAENRNSIKCLNAHPQLHAWDPASDGVT